MAGGLGGHAGGIRGLLDLNERTQGAVEADLIDRGLRLRDVGNGSLTWRDVRVVVKHLPADSATARALRPEHTGWDPATWLAAEAADCLRWLVWAKTEDGMNGVRRPEPVHRPGARGREEQGGGTTIAQLRETLGLPPDPRITT